MLETEFLSCATNCFLMDTRIVKPDLDPQDFEAGHLNRLGHGGRPPKQARKQAT